MNKASFIYVAKIICPVGIMSSEGGAA